MAVKKPKTFLTIKNNKSQQETNKDTEVFNGVYLIHNTLHNKRYVGSTKDINRRFKTHKRELEMGSHNNRKMQKDYDEAGPSHFIYTVLERDLDESMLTAYEKYYMYIHDSIVMYVGYNDMFPTTNHKLFQQVCRIKHSTSPKKYSIMRIEEETTNDAIS